MASDKSTNLIDPNLNSFSLPNLYSPLQRDILKVLLKNGESTRSKLVKTLETPRTTIYDNLLKLEKKGIVKRFPKNDGKRGRSYVYWRITENEVKR